MVAGPSQALSSQVPNALTATLSAGTFAAIARGASGWLKTADLMALISPLNPVVNSGYSGPGDCLYAQATITSFALGTTTFTLTPQAGGLYIDAELDQLEVGMHLTYAAACISGKQRHHGRRWSHVSVAGNLTVGVNGGNFAIALANPNVTLTGFDLELGGIPGDVVDLLDLNAVFGPILGWATEKFVVPMLNSSLANLNNTKTVAVLGSMVDISVTPSKIDFTQDGAIVELDTSLRAHGDSGNFVFVANTVPAMDLSQGFQLAVADDTANQLLTSLWSAKGLDDTLQLANGPYGDIGKLYDSVEIAAAAPPFVDASGTGLVLTVGDLMATFRNGTTVATEVAINAQVDLKVVKGSDEAGFASTSGSRRCAHRHPRRLRRRDGRESAVERAVRGGHLVRVGPSDRGGCRLDRRDSPADGRRRVGRGPLDRRSDRVPRGRRTGPVGPERSLFPGLEGARRVRQVDHELETIGILDRRDLGEVNQPGRATSGAIPGRWFVDVERSPVDLAVVRHVGSALGRDRDRTVVVGPGRLRADLAGEHASRAHARWHGGAQGEHESPHTGPDVGRGYRVARLEAVSPISRVPSSRHVTSDTSLRRPGRRHLTS